MRHRALIIGAAAGGAALLVLALACAGGLLIATRGARSRRADAPQEAPWPERDRIVRHVLTAWHPDADDFRLVSRRESPGRVDVVVRYRAAPGGARGVVATYESSYRLSSDVLIQTGGPREVSREARP